ncbi:hypothetical protein R84B8_01582 [Treponema sp. R8-4-B8]
MKKTVTDLMVISDDPKTPAMVNRKWLPMTAFKQAYYYTYSFEKGNLMLELEDFLPKAAFVKQ